MMTVKLSLEQTDALQRRGDQPLVVVHLQTQQRYLLVSADDFLVTPLTDRPQAPPAINS